MKLYEKRKFDCCCFTMQHSFFFITFAKILTGSIFDALEMNI